jgi:hypothetical protein
LFLIPVFNFSTVYALFKKFHFLFHPCIYWTLIRLTPCISVSHLLLPLINQQFSECFLMPPSYTDAVYFDTFHSLSLSFNLFPFPLLTDTMMYYSAMKKIEMM